MTPFLGPFLFLWLSVSFVRKGRVEPVTPSGRMKKDKKKVFIRRIVR